MNLVPANLTLEWIAAMAGGLLAMAGIVLAFMGRWRRIDDHPVCRKCGYDLTGKPETSTRCSECGADLKGRKAIRIGNRRRSAGLLRVGWIVIVLGLGGLGWSGYRYGRTINWMPYMPLSWLAADMDTGSATASPKARDEILRRMKEGLISLSDEGWLVEHLLERHADPAWPLPGDWEKVLIQSLARQRVSAQQLDRYIDQVRTRASAAFSAALQVPPQLRRGEAVTFKIATSGVNVGRMYNGSVVAAYSAINFARMPSGSPFIAAAGKTGAVDARYTVEEIHLGGKRVAVLPRTQEDLENGLLVHPDWSQIAHLPDGVHEFSVGIHLELFATLRITTDLRAVRQVTIVSE